jgi:hypothetical protein
MRYINQLKNRGEFVLKKKLFIHIGLNKAASTTIQTGLFENRRQLAGNGIFIPMTGKPPHRGAGHQNIAWEIIKHKRYRANLGGINELLVELESTQLPTTIITSEYFSLFDQSQKKKLRRKLSNYSVIIIIYVRRQDKWLQSLWSEITKMGLCGATFEKYTQPKNIRRLLGSFNASDYYDLVFKWGKFFGHDHIKVRVLEKEWIVSHPFHDLLFTCGVDNYGDYPIPESMNVSPGIRTLETIRGLTVNLTSRGFTHPEIGKVASWVRKYGDQNGWNNQKLNLIDEAAYNKIMGLFEESNKKLANKYLNRSKLFTETFDHQPTTNFKIEDLSSEELFDLFGYLLRRANEEKVINKNE